MSPGTAGPAHAHGEAATQPGAFGNRSPLRSFALVLGLSVPFWLMGAASGLQLLPGLSVSALMAFCPPAAALILVCRENKVDGVRELLARSFDFERIRAKRWYAPILLPMAAVNTAVYGLMRSMDMPVPAPQVSVLPTLLMFGAFFSAPWAKNWVGRDTSPTRCRIDGTHCRQASSWGS